MRSKQAKAREFPAKVREEIKRRDGGCIFCKQNYHMEDTNPFAANIMSIMHYVPRSKNGLGIPPNGALGCIYHHEMLDNGNSGRRKEMLEIFAAYLKKCYPDWNEDNLVYRKWR